MQQQQAYVPAINFPRSKINIFARIVCFASVCPTEIFYSWFLQGATVDAIVTAAGIFGATIAKENNVVQGVAWAVCAFNLAGDMLAANPLREADDLTQPSSAAAERQTWRQWFQSKDATYWVNLVLQALPMLTFSYQFGASADVVPLADQKISQAAIYLFLGFFSFVGTVYYWMIGNDNIKKFSAKLVDTAKNHKAEFVKNMLTNPVYWEVTIQCISNAIYRGVAFNYITGAVLNSVWGVAKDSTLAQSLSWAVGAATVVNALTARSFPTMNKYLNPALKYLRQDEIDAVPDHSNMLDNIFSGIRGVAAAASVISLSPETEWLWPLMCLIGGGLVLHSAWVRDKVARKEAAFNNLSERRKAEIERQVKDENPQAEEEKTAAQKHAEQFDEAKKIPDENISWPMYGALNSINWIGRLARFVAFFGFVASFNTNSLNESLNNVGTISLTFLWGAEVFKNEGANFYKWIKGSLEAYSLQWKLTEGHGLFRLPKTILSSAYDYSTDKLNETLGQRQALLV